MQASDLLWASNKNDCWSNLYTVFMIHKKIEEMKTYLIGKSIGQVAPCPIDFPIR